MSSKARTHQASGQIRTDEDAFEIVYLTSYKLSPVKRKGINLSRIGRIDFNLTNAQIINCMSKAKIKAERANKAVGGFMRQVGDRSNKIRTHSDAVTIV